MKRATGRGGASDMEWPTVALIAVCYAGWAGAGALYTVWPAISLLLLGVLLALQSSLMHEVLHGHPTRNARVNELFVALPIGLVYPYRRFKALHLRHHADERLTDPFDDPESYYQALWRHEELPHWLKLVLSANNTMVGRLVLGPPLGTFGFYASEWRSLREGDRALRRAWLLHIAGLVIVIPVVTYGFGIPLWLYVVVPVWLGQSIIAIRTYAEHQWSERPDGRTIIVENSPLSLLFLNNNLHLVHHKQPNAAWYRLPALFRERREEWMRMNEGYVYPGYLSLLRDFAFRGKEPVVHPFLRRVRDAGSAFRPRVRAPRFGGIAGTAAAPAEPPKE